MEKVDFEKIAKTLLPYIIIIVVIILLRLFVITTISVSGTSMSPTLKDGDVMLLSKLHYNFNEIKRFDIIVVHHKGEDIIKRVIGLPGEKVEYIDNVLYINGEKVDEPFEHKKTDDFNLSKWNTEVVPENSYFVVGDNRTDSYDSRYFGFVSRNDIAGMANITIFPFNRIGIK